MREELAEVDAIEVNEDIKLQILPTSDDDGETQRCRVGPKIFQKIGARLDSAVWIRLNEKKKVLCTLWPRCDNYNSFIQPSHLVTWEHKSNCSSLENNENFITTANIDHIASVGVIKTVRVCVIVDDYTKVQRWHVDSSDVQFKVRNALRNLILCTGCEVNVKETVVGKLFELSYITVNSMIVFNGTDDDNQCENCGRLAENSEVIIDAVRSSERYHQQYKQHTRFQILGGVDRELACLKEIVQLPHTCKTKLTGFKFAKGVLLQGPPGCGKSSLVHQVGRDCDAYLIVINGPEVFASRPGETEHNLALAFKKAEIISKEGPCILFLDEVDALCPARGRSGTSVEHRVVSRLLSLIDHVTTIDHVTVIGATNNPGALDAAIRRPGRLEKEILIGVPNLHRRGLILASLTTHTPLSAEVDLSNLAESTPGFVGADLVALVQQAHYGAVSEWQKSGGDATSKDKISPQVRPEHFKVALHSIVPSTQRGSDILVEYKPVLWSDIGGLEEVKVKLKQAVEWPLKHPEAFARLGLPRPRGILLYGPPGCAKTTLVRAAATSCHVTFLAISGGQLYSPYVGDSERKLTQVFQQARAGAPSILFIDELDSVIGSRSHGDGGKGVQERVISTLLNEMDGIGIKADSIVRSHDRVTEGQGSSGQQIDQTASSSVDNSDVLVIAATNRPDMLDDAIMRPGRIDRIIYVPPPDKQARAGILRVHTRRIPLEGVDVDELANQTNGYTGADLENLCREAALHALSDNGLTANRVSWHHFEQVLSTLKPSLTPEELEQYSQIKGKLRLKSS